MSRYTEAFQQFFGPLSPAQRAMFVGLMLVLLGIMGGLLYWAQQEDQTLLFGSLQPASAQEIVAELETRSVSYELRNGGTAIYVPSNQVHELRLALAPLSGGLNDIKGYELFDTNTLGMTDFMQQVNQKRALEGELARSINSLEQIEFSRVHLVLPERSPFEQANTEASASVILNLKKGSKLNKNQIDGISALIAGSVESLDSGNVTILDQAGNRLTDEIDYEDEFGFGSTQMQLRQKTEAYLIERGQSMLDRVLGAGNSILRVSVKHDFDRLLRESDLIDPDSRTIISEEKTEQTSSDQLSEPLPIDQRLPAEQRGTTINISNNENSTTSQTRNYEVNRTREVFEKTQGGIENLTASVLLNYKKNETINENGEGVVEYVPYPPEEIEEFREIVMMALGMQVSRGDFLSIKQIEFFDQNFLVSDFYSTQPGFTGMFRWILIGLTLIAIIYLLNSIRKGVGKDDFQIISEFKMDDMLNETEEAANLPGSDENEALGEHSEEGQIAQGDIKKQLPQRNYNKEEIVNFIELKPAEAAQVMRALIATED